MQKQRYVRREVTDQPMQFHGPTAQADLCSILPLENSTIFTIYSDTEAGLSKQCGPRSYATERGFSGSALFATHPADFSHISTGSTMGLFKF